MARRPGNTVLGSWRGPAESARPTAPEDLIEPLKMGVYGRPVMKGVEDAKDLALAYNN